ncbi:hypothetical protein Bca4012_026978 [Brassica carinata]
MTSRKRSSKKQASPQSSSGNPGTNEEVVPKEEFEVEQPEKKAYWDALCSLIPPSSEVFYPPRPAARRDPILPSRTSPSYLRTLEKYYRVPSGVVFRIPVVGKGASLFDAEFKSFKDAQDYVGDFRECRGSVGTLWKSQDANFCFLSEIAEMSSLMDGCAQAESMVPPIEGRIRELWDPIEVSEDTAEVEADAADEEGEVGQPMDSFGVSISGYLDLHP